MKVNYRQSLNQNKKINPAPSSRGVEPCGKKLLTIYPRAKSAEHSGRCGINVFDLIIFAVLLLFVFISPVKAQTDEWTAITPPNTNGVTFNTVSVISNYIFIGSNNGVYKSDDAGANWANSLTTECGSSACNITSIAIGWTYDGSGYVVDDSSLIFAGTSNGGIFQSTIGNPAWSQVNTGLSDANVQDIEIDQYQATQGSFTNIYAGTPSGVFRSDDSGQTWSLKNSGMAGEQAIKLSSDFGGALIYALTNTNKLYSSALFSSSGTDESWSLIYDGGGATLNDINASLGALNWLAMDSGILKSNDAGATWVSKNNGLGAGVINNVISDYADSNIAYAALANNGVYRTTNEAEGTPEWLPINKNLSDLNIKEVKTDPAASTAVHAVSASGIYQLLLSASYPYIDLTPPADISDLAASYNTDTSVMLGWTAAGDDLTNAGGLVANDVRYSTSLINASNWANATQAVGEPTSDAPGVPNVFIVQNLISGATYYFAVKAIDDAGNESALSNVASYPPADTTAPAEITDLSVGSSTVNSITLTWTAPGDDGSSGTALIYEIRYSTSNINNSQKWNDATAAISTLTVSGAAGTSETYTVNGLNSETKYYFAIKTADEAPNWSDISNSPNATTATSADTTSPDAISDIAVSSVSQTSVTLSWTAPGDDNNTGTAAEYDIRYSTSIINSGNWNDIASSSATTTPQIAGSSESYTINNLLGDTTYYFAIRTADEAGNYSFAGLQGSDRISTTTLDLIAPGKINDLSIDNITQTTVRLNWTAPGDNGNSGTANNYDIRYYTLEITTDNWASSTIISNSLNPKTASSSEQQTINDLTRNTKYYFAIISYDEKGNVSDISNVISATTLDNPSPNSNAGGNNNSSGGGGSYTPLTPSTPVATTTPAKVLGTELEPLGKLVKLQKDNKIYFVKNGEKRWVPNMIIFNSHGYSLNDVKEITEEDFNSYKAAGDLSLAENSLIMSDAGPRIYIIKNGKRHWIPSEAVFNANGYKWDKILKVDASLVKSYEDGEDLIMPVLNNNTSNGLFAYGKARLKSLPEEQKLALELRQKLEKNYSKKQLKGINGKNWNTITNSYIYGGYSVEAIVKAIKFGGKTVHPAISYEKWKGSKDYLEYIKK